MVDANFEMSWDSLSILVDTISNLLSLKKDCSLIDLGGGNCQLGQLVAQKIGAMTHLYADDVSNESVIIKADDLDLFTTTLDDITKPEQIAALGKYDGAIVKGVLELGIENLEEYFNALYKILKLNGKAILIARLSPCFPLPQSALDFWTQNVPKMERIKKAAEDADFEIESELLSCPIRTPTAAFIDLIRQRKLPGLKDAEESEIDEFLKEYDGGDYVEFNDDLTLITLTKVIA